MPVTSPRKRPVRYLLRAVVAVAALVVVLAAGIGPAAAHADLVATTPADGQSVPTPPPYVSATFSEDVSAEVGGLTVRDTEGELVDEGDSTATGTTVTVTMPGDLPEGTYIATYRVLSSDGHPISGSWLFGVGSGPVDPSVSGTGTGDGPWEVVGAVARFVTFVSALLAAGVAFFLAFLHDQRADRWKLVPVVRISAVVGLFGIVGQVVGQAALLTGDGLGAATDSDVLRSVLTDRLGWSAAVLLIGLAVVHLSTDLGRLLPAQVLALTGGLAVTGSFALWGHDTEAPHRWLAVGSDVVHVAAAAVWFGGLVGLVSVLRRREPHPVRSTGSIVVRFSDAAAISVAALIVAGVAMTWIETGSLDALWSTTYGRLVMVKVAITAGVLVMAAMNRFRLVPAIVAGAEVDPEEPDEQVVTAAATSPTSATTTSHGDGVADATTTTGSAQELDDGLEDPLRDPTESELQSWRWIELRRMVSYEALALVVVLAFTAVLVNTTPGRTSVTTEPKVVNLTEATESGEVDLVVTPARIGTNSIHVQYTGEDGRPTDIATTLAVEMSLPEKDLGPITRDVVRISPGHFVLEGDELSLAGDWTITLAVRTSDFTEERTTFSVPISK